VATIGQFLETPMRSPFPEYLDGFAMGRFVFLAQTTIVRAVILDVPSIRLSSPSTASHSW
jgi:hypothetical protein